MFVFVNVFGVNVLSVKQYKKKKHLHGNSSGTVKKLVPTLLKKKQTMYFITVT